MYIIQCDCCGKESEPNNTTAYPEDWISMRLQVVGITSFTYDNRGRVLCPTCITKYNIEKKPDSEKRKSNLNKLWDIMLDLAEEARNEI